MEINNRMEINEVKAMPVEQNDNVSHPAHYQGKNECIDIMRAMFGDDDVAAFCKCNAFKYRFVPE